MDGVGGVVSWIVGRGSSFMDRVGGVVSWVG